MVLVMDCDYKNILDCAYNRKPQRVPLYDHYVSDRIMERLTGKKFADAIQSKETYDLYFENYCAFSATLVMTQLRLRLA